MRERWILCSIIALATFLRLFDLGKNPPGLYWDEVSLGWNAYSLLKTGMDEHGRFLPLDTFYAFGDYKPPFYIYATVPSIAVFGLNEFAVRLPSAFAGIGLVVVTYFLCRIILRTDLEYSRSVLSRWTPLFSTLLVAISPWSLTLSRVAFESNLATFFNALGVLFFLYAVKRSPKWLILSVVNFVLAAYTFNANRLLSPLFLISLSVLYHKTAFREWKWWAGGALLGMILMLPMTGHLLSPAGKVRWNEVNIFSDLSVIQESNQRRAVDDNTIVSRLFHHRFLGYFRLWAAHYADFFNLTYLFIKGDSNPRISVPNQGELYLIELPFFLLGFVFVLRGFAMGQSNSRLLFLWLLLAPLPGSFARETPHALRSASMLPVPQIIVAIGVMSVVSRMSQIRKIKALLFAFCFLLFLSLASFQLVYYRYYPDEWAGLWLTSYKNLVRYVSSVEDQYKRIYVVPDLGRPYIYFLFYGNGNPKSFIKEAAEGGRTGDIFGFYSVNYFGKYQFSVPRFEEINTNELVVTRADPPPSGFRLLTTIRDTNGFPEFNVIARE